LHGGIEILQPYSDHPNLGGAYEQLRARLPHDEDESEQLAEGLTKISKARAELAKAEGIDGMERVRLQQQLAKSERELQHEIAVKSDPGGYAHAMANRQAEQDARRANLAGRAAWDPDLQTASARRLPRRGCPQAARVRMLPAQCPDSVGDSLVGRRRGLGRLALIAGATVYELQTPGDPTARAGSPRYMP
jgi:hypothetical protein